MPTSTTTSDVPAPARRRDQLQSRAITAVAGLATLIVLARLGELHGLAKAAGVNGAPKGGGSFASFQTYLDNLQTALVPLAIPAGTLGLIGGGIAYLIGSQIAQKLLGGVVIGLGLVLLAPELVK